MERTNLEALRAKCKLICDTCYADDDVLIDVLEDAGISQSGNAVPNNVEIVKAAIVVVKGWVESNRSEGGINVSINREAVEKNILFWCQRFGLDASEYLSESMTVIQDGSLTY
jgi:hypothetical protein